jgi:hypothetical protein
MRREATDVPVAQPFPLGSAVSRRQGRVWLIVAEIEAEDRRQGATIMHWVGRLVLLSAFLGVGSDA